MELRNHELERIYAETIHEIAEGSILKGDCVMRTGRDADTVEVTKGMIDDGDAIDDG